jgi:hypothetical protein
LTAKEELRALLRDLCTDATLIDLRNPQLETPLHHGISAYLFSIMCECECVCCKSMTVFLTGPSLCCVLVLMRGTNRDAFVAVMWGRAENAEALLDLGADIDAVTRSGSHFSHCPLFTHTHTLSLCSEPSFPVPDQSPLPSTAAAATHVPSWQLLTRPLSKGDTALTLACAAGHVGCVRLLLARGAFLSPAILEICARSQKDFPSVWEIMCQERYDEELL